MFQECVCVCVCVSRETFNKNNKKPFFLSNDFNVLIEISKNELNINEKLGKKSHKIFDFKKIEREQKAITSARIS